MQGSKSAAAFTVAVALSAWAANDSVEADRQQSAFRAGVDLVSFSVTATDSSRRYVPDLVREDFVVTENGVPQSLTFFAKAGTPLALGLLIDTSASMEQSLATAQEAAVGFVRQIAPSDLVTVVGFDSKVQIAQAPTSDRQVLENVIRQTRAGGSTALYNAVYITLKELNKLPIDTAGMPRRRAIIVLSDGEDTSSLVGFDEVLDLAARSDTIIYTIGLGLSAEAARHNDGDGQFVLRRLAQQTGGRAFFPQRVNDLAAIYNEVRDELSSQYALAYESSNAPPDGQWRRVTVRVGRPGVVVRTRPGYFAPAR
ncbi:MAG: VWA domain-containing protein [Vicinamibacterales bacterium]